MGFGERLFHSMVRSKELLSLEKQHRDIGRGMGKLIERLEQGNANVEKWERREREALEFVRPIAERDLRGRDERFEHERAEREQRRERDRERGRDMGMDLER